MYECHDQTIGFILQGISAEWIGLLNKNPCDAPCYQLVAKQAGELFIVQSVLPQANVL